MGLTSKVGGLLNDVMGVTSSAKQQQGAQMAMQKDAQNYATWQMGNAHQQEVDDLKKAGLNPVLSANGGASAGVAEGSASTGVGADPIGMIANIINTMNNSAKTETDINNSTKLTNAQVNKLLADAGFTEKQIEFYNKTGVFPGATETTSGGFGAGWGLVDANYTQTRPVSAKDYKYNDGSKKPEKKPEKLSRIARQFNRLSYHTGLQKEKNY